MFRRICPLWILLTTVPTAASGQVPDVVPQPPRVENLCGVSVDCFPRADGVIWGGLLVLPQANVGLVQIPWGGSEDGPSFRDGLGLFKPSIGLTAKLWFLEGFLDGHIQLIYGQAPDYPNGVENYLWGVSGGFGALWIVNIDFAFLNRRVRSNSENVDEGVAFLINIDLTGGVLGVASGE